MEDANVGILSLDKGAEDSNAFFAVYDGHSGVFPWLSIVVPSSHRAAGSSVSTFAATNVHKRLVTEEAYHEKRYEEALKRAFLATDEDMLASMFFILFIYHRHSKPESL